MFARHRNRAGRNGGIDEARPVGLVSSEREKQVARLHRAAVDREALDLDQFRLWADRGVVAKKVAKSHSFGPAGRAGGCAVGNSNRRHPVAY